MTIMRRTAGKFGRTCAHNPLCRGRPISGSPTSPATEKSEVPFYYSDDDNCNPPRTPLPAAPLQVVCIQESSIDRRQRCRWTRHLVSRATLASAYGPAAVVPAPPKLTNQIVPYDPGAVPEAWYSSFRFPAVQSCRASST
jgi:hypothetical protein